MGTLPSSTLVREAATDPVDTLRLHAPQSRSTLSGMGLADAAIFNADISKGDVAALKGAFTGADALVIATSAVPVLRFLSLIPVFWAKLTGAPTRPRALPPPPTQAGPQFFLLAHPACGAAQPLCTEAGLLIIPPPPHTHTRTPRRQGGRAARV